MSVPPNRARRPFSVGSRPLVSRFPALVSARLLMAASALPLALNACGDKADSTDPTPPDTRAAATPVRDGGNAPAKPTRTPGTFEPALLTEFLGWTPVLDGDVAFESRGHGGILVRSYLNPVAAEAARGAAEPYPLPVGSLLAKAVVADADTPARSATRVYFMRKEAPGFDPANGDWSYAQAKRTAAGKFEYDASVGPKQDYCVACHGKFARFDYVQTVDFFRRQSTMPAR